MTDTNQQQQPQPCMPHPSSIPKSMTRSFLVLQVPTDAWVQIFADRIVMGVSQLEGKIGTYLLCEAVTSPTNLRQTEFHLSTLLGNRTDDSSAMMGVYARTLMERLRKYHESNITTTTTTTTIIMLWTRGPTPDPRCCYWEFLWTRKRAPIQKCSNPLLIFWWICTWMLLVISHSQQVKLKQIIFAPKRSVPQWKLEIENQDFYSVFLHYAFYY